MNCEHLSDEQFADLLADEIGNGGAQAHLAVCATCRHEAEAVKFAAAGFNDLSMVWAREQAPRRIQTPSRWSLYLGGRPAWGIGIAATVTACLMTFGLSLPNAYQRAMESAQMPSGMPSNTDLAEDNHLMKSIDRELQYEAAPVIPASELRVTTRRGEGRTPVTVLN